MKFSEKYNKSSRVFDIDTTGFVFAKLKELYAINKDDVHVLDGLYINDGGKFDPHPVAILSDERFLVDLPSHMTDTVKDMLKDDESIYSIKKSFVGFKVREYTDKKYGKVCYSVEWVDL